MAQLHALDWLAIAFYLALAIAVGTRLTRRASKSTAEFYLAGRSLPWWIAGTSLVATTFAADTPLIITGWVRTAGVSKNWIWWGMALGGCLSFTVLAAYWRRLHVTTDAELIERRYTGASARVLRATYAGYHALVSNTIVLGWVLLAMIKVTRVVLGIEDGDHDVYIVAGALALALTYSILAGLWGVAITDLFQFLIALAAAVILAWIVIAELGGLSSAQDAFERVAGDKLELIPLPVKGEGGWTALSFFTQGFCSFLVFFGVLGWANKNADGGGIAVQRYSACRSEEQARGAALWYHIAHYCLRPWPWILVALASIVLIENSALPLTDAGLPDHEMAYPMMLARYLGPGLFGLACAGFIAAFMSTIDTHLNMASAYSVNDIYRRFIAKDRGERHYVWVGRGMEVVVALLGAAVALTADSLNDLFVLTLSLLGGLGPALLLRWFWWRANAWTEISALATSVTLTLVIGVLPDSIWPAAPFNGFQAGIAWDAAGRYLVIILAALVVMLVTTFLTKPVDRDHLRRFFVQVHPLGRWNPVRREAKTTVARRAGFAALQVWLGGVCFILGLTLLIGALLLGLPWQLYAWIAWLGMMALIWGWSRSVVPILD